MGPRRSACSLAEQIVETMEAEPLLAVDWVDTERLSPGRLGITVCPGGATGDGTWRGCGSAAGRGSRPGAVPPDRHRAPLGGLQLGSRAEAFGLNYRWLPVPDQGTCSLSEAVDLVAWCRDGLKRGEPVVVTCMGGLGRSGMIAACTLVDVGVSPTAAIASVRAARGPRALETSGQEELVSTFAAS